MPFASVLGRDFAKLPKPVRDLHQVRKLGRYTGRADVERGRGPVVRFICKALNLPRNVSDAPLSFTLVREGEDEIWLRDFDGNELMSRISPHAERPDLIHERFGPLTFDLSLTVTDGRLNYEIQDMRYLGLRVPRRLWPKAQAAEHAEGNAFHFFVEINLPIIGRLIRYQGWLMPEKRDRQS